VRRVLVPQPVHTVVRLLQPTTLTTCAALATSSTIDPVTVAPPSKPAVTIPVAHATSVATVAVPHADTTSCATINTDAVSASAIMPVWRDVRDAARSA
jgi:hypothetical protein